MVAMTISSVLILGSITIYNQARANYRTAESVARLQESIRYVSDTLEQDIRMAGYWGRTNRGSLLTLDPAIRITCDADNDVTDWAIGNNRPAVEAVDDVPVIACNGTNMRSRSDILTVRHAAAE